MAKSLTITQKRQILGTLLILLAVIQIINFAIRNVYIKPVFLYSSAHFTKSGILGVIISDLNYPFKMFNYLMYRIFGWAGLLSPFFFSAIGYTCFKRRTPKLKKTRMLLLWFMGEVMLFIYVVNYVSFMILPRNVRPGLVAEVFSKYLKKVGGVSFLVLFFLWSAISLLLYMRKSNWRNFFEGVRVLFARFVLLFTSLFSHLFSGRAKDRQQKQQPKKIANNRKTKSIEDKTESVKKESKTTESQKDNNAKNDTEKKEKSESENNKREVIEAEFSVSHINQFDSTSIGYSFPFDALSKNSETEVDQEEIDELSTKIREVFNSFGINLNQTGLTRGPQLLRFEYEIPTGTQLKEVEKYKVDLSHRIGGLQVNIQTPIPGTNSFGIYIPRKKPDLLGQGSYLSKISERNEKIPVLIGVSSEGEGIWADAVDFPHMLIAGSTGSGKSVFINNLLIGLLAVSQHVPINFVLIDPKRVELSPYKDIPQLAAPIVLDVPEARDILTEVEKIMEERYDQLNKSSVRNIQEYNEKKSDAPLPFLFVIIDEFSDMILQDPSKTIKNAIVRLAQKSRAVGIHIVIATQRPSSDVIDGLIKANFPSRVAFRTSSQVDSRIILDENGAESLLGKGDMVYKSASSENMRLQGVYVSLEEINKIVKK